MQQTPAQSGEALKITFIITYHNEPLAMLQECIDSVLSLRLTSGEREIIVVDDGSKEEPKEVLNRYAGSICYIRQENQGLSVARNMGMQHATGTHIQFIDADDYLLPEGYTHSLATLRKDGPDLLMFDFTRDKNHKHISTESSPMMSGAEYMRGHNLRAAAWSYIFRKEILGNLRFTPGLYHEDEEFTPRLMLQAKRVVHEKTRAYFYRTRKGSIVNDSATEHIRKRLDDMEHIILHLNDIASTHPLPEKEALQRRVHQLTMDYLYNIITLTRSSSQLEVRIMHLSPIGLFPLPKNDYTIKYKWFRRLVGKRWGRKLMILILPKI